MVMGVGGSSFAAELDRMRPLTGAVQPITVEEYQARIARAQSLMREQGIDALYLDTSTNLRYFTGIALGLTERLHGAVIPAEGEIAYLSPSFEEPKTRTLLRFGTDIRCWEEHEDPTALVIETVRSMGIASGTLALDPSAPFFTVDGYAQGGQQLRLHQRRGHHGRLPDGEIRGRDRVDAGCDGHHTGGAQGRLSLHGAWPDNAGGAGFPGRGPSRAGGSARVPRGAVRRGHRLPSWRAVSADLA